MEDFGLNLDNILDPEELAELSGNQDTTEENGETPPVKEELNEDIKDTEDLDINDLFGSESVGDDNSKEVNKVEKEDTNTKQSKGTSPNNLYSSIAQAFKVDGIFPDLEDSDIEGVNTPEDFRALVDKHLESMFDERQKRIDKALNNGVEPSQIQIFESSIANLNRIKEDDITDESDEGIALRRALIRSDYINRGVSEKRADALTQRAFDNNTDVEDALEALKGNKEYYSSKYQELLDAADKEAKENTAKRKKEIETLKQSILEGDKAFGEVSVDKKTRQRVYEVISKPVYKDESGNYLTEIQKYEVEHKADFMKNLGYLYVVTDGFKSLDKLTSDIKKKVTANGIKELEHTLNTTTRNLDGSLKFVSGVGDNDSYISSGWSIDTK